MKNLHSKSFRPSLESLEQRQMLAGDVLAFVSSGHLHVVEASGQFGSANAVQISQLANGNLRVKGIGNMDGGTTKVNGAAFRDFAVRGDLKVNLAGGRDTVILVANTTFNNVFINTAATSPVGTTDGDVVIVDRVTTRGLMTIDTGASGDWVTVLGSRIGDDALDNLIIRTGSGGDNVLIKDSGRFTAVRGNLSVRTYDSVGENDVDNVTMENLTVFKTVTAMLGGGSDFLKATQVTAGNDILIAADGGSDRVTMDSVQAIDDFWVFMGEGSDTLTGRFLQADELTLDGGAGKDMLFKSVDGPVNRLFVSGFEPLIAIPIFVPVLQRV